MEFHEVSVVEQSLDKLACMGCLHEASDIRKVTNQEMVMWYCETVDIPISKQQSSFSLSLCWECVELTQKIIQFKIQVKQAYEALQKCTSSLAECLPRGPRHGESVSAGLRAVKEEERDMDIEADDNFADTTSYSDENPPVVLKRESKSTLRKRKGKRKAQSPPRQEFERILTDAGDKKYKCDMCDSAFMRPSQVATHRRIHTGEKPFKCDECASAFRQIQHLRTHQRTHSAERPFKCDLCDASFKLLQHLVKHNRIHTGEKPYSCDVCDAAFRQQAALVSHRRIHTGDKPYQCDECGVSFRVRSALTTHMAVHTGVRKHRCDVCDRLFGTATILKIHLRVHTRERPYTCDACGLSFKQMGDMKSHRKSKHEGL